MKKKVFIYLLTLGFAFMHISLFSQKPNIHVFIMAGQSNMVGLGIPTDLPANLQGTFTGVTIKAGGDPVKGWLDLSPAFGTQGTRFGSELTFGRDIYNNFNGEKVAIIKYSVGGTHLYGNWRPPSSGGTTGTLYTNLINFSQACFNELNVNYNVIVHGICWMQGESDAQSDVWANEYHTNLPNFINDVRNALGQGPLPFVIGMIDVQTVWTYNSIIRQVQLDVANNLTNVRTFDTKGLTTDGVHYTAAGLVELGHLFAQNMTALVKPNCTTQTITFNSISNKNISDQPFTITAKASSGLPVTFSIVSGPATISGNKITLKGSGGQVMVAANQIGDATYCGAPQKTQTFTVSDPNAPPIIWHFLNSEEGWNLLMRYDSSVTVSILKLTITGADPFMHSPDNINAVAASYPYIIIKAKNSCVSSDAKIYFVTSSATGYDEAKSVPFIINANDNGYSEYVVNMSANSGWTGTIKQIRLDMPQSGSSGVVEIDYIALNNSSVLTSIKKNDDSNLSNIINIYPNPIEGNGFYIEIDQNKPTSENYIELLNMQGQIIYSKPLHGYSKEYIQLDKSFSKRVYLLKYTGEKYMIVKKIILN